MAYQIYHFQNNHWGYVSRVDDIDGIHQYFTNIRVLHGGWMDIKNKKITLPDGSYYLAAKVSDNHIGGIT